MEIIKVDKVSTQFGLNLIHDKISFSINKGDIYGILGGSGSGKSTIMREIMLLEPIQSGNIMVLEQNIRNLSINELYN